MGFMDLFRPKWRHSDIDVRLEAVPGIRDTATLKKLCLEDEAWCVRNAALAGLTNQEDLLEVALQGTDASIRAEAARRITDVSKLPKILRANDDLEMQEAVVTRIQDQRALARLAKDGDTIDIRCAAVARVKDQALLLGLAKTSPIPAVREAAIEHLRQQKDLFTAILECEDATTQAAAAQRLTDPDLLEALFAQDIPSAVRCNAFPNLADSRIKRRILLAERDSFTRSSYLEHCEPALLRELAEDASLPDALREMATKGQEKAPRIKSQPPRRAWSDINTKGQVWPSGTGVEARHGTRLAGCSACKKVYALGDAVPYRVEWDRHYAHYYFCPVCNPSPNPKGDTWHLGALVGTDGERIIDQVEMEE